MVCKDINAEAYAILESEEFDILLDALELMAKAGSDISSLENSVEELRSIIDNDDILEEDFAIYNTLETVESLLNNFSSKDVVSL